MRMISSSPGHHELLSVIDEALPRLNQRVASAAALIEDVRVEKERFAALPWYKRWFSLCEPSYEHARMTLHFAKENVKLAEKIRDRCSYDLTIELSDKEANIIFGS